MNGRPRFGHHAAMDAAVCYVRWSPAFAPWLDSSWPSLAHTMDHDGVLRMHPVLCLPEDVRLRRLEHAVRRLLAPA